MRRRSHHERKVSWTDIIPKARGGGGGQEHLEVRLRTITEKRLRYSEKRGG